MGQDLPLWVAVWPSRALVCPWCVPGVSRAGDGTAGGTVPPWHPHAGSQCQGAVGASCQPNSVPEQ